MLMYTYKDRLLNLRDDHISRIINDIEGLQPYKYV